MNTLRTRKTAASVNPEPAVARAFDTLLRGLGSKASRDGYEKDWVAFREWLAANDLDVLKVEADDIERYIAVLLEAGKAKATRARALSVLRETYRVLVNKKLLAYNPAREAKNPKHGGTKRTPWMEEEELGKMLGFGESSAVWKERRDRMCIQLVAGIGWRRSEIARMKVEDFVGGAGWREGEGGPSQSVIVKGIVKGGKEATATVAPWLLKEIAAWRKFAGIGRGFLLPRAPDDSKAISGDIVYTITQAVAVAVGVEPSKAAPHAFRRSLATHANRRGVAMADIQHSLGHSTIAVTERYIKGSHEVAHAPGDWMAELAAKGKP